MRRIAAFVLLLSLLFTLCACRSSIPQSNQNSADVLSDTLRQGLEVPEISAEEVMLSYPVDEAWTLTNAEGETLRYDGTQFSGSIEILEKYSAGYNGYPPSHLQIRIPASNSFTFQLDEPGKTIRTGFTIYDLIQDGAEHEIYGVAEGLGLSTAVIDTLGVEIRGENMTGKACTREYSQDWMFSLEAESASYMSIFSQPFSTEAVLDTDGDNADIWIEHKYMLELPRNISALEGMPLKLTNLQSEDMTLIEAVPYED